MLQIVHLLSRLFRQADLGSVVCLKITFKKLKKPPQQMQQTAEEKKVSQTYIWISIFPLQKHKLHLLRENRWSDWKQQLDPLWWEYFVNYVSVFWAAQIKSICKKCVFESGHLRQTSKSTPLICVNWPFETCSHLSANTYNELTDSSSEEPSGFSVKLCFVRDVTMGYRGRRECLL